MSSFAKYRLITYLKSLEKLIGEFQSGQEKVRKNEKSQGKM